MARTLDSVSVADIIAAVDEPLDATMCGGRRDCHDSGRVGGGLRDDAQTRGQCMTHDLWATLNRKMHEYLESVSLADLIRQQQERDTAAAAQSGAQPLVMERRRTGAALAA
jgi:Rrf2 family iron-sulfur cluster assembly transcriptional regulator